MLQRAIRTCTKGWREGGGLIMMLNCRGTLICVLRAWLNMFCFPLSIHLYIYKIITSVTPGHQYWLVIYFIYLKFSPITACHIFYLSSDFKLFYLKPMVPIASSTLFLSYHIILKNMQITHATSRTTLSINYNLGFSHSTLVSLAAWQEPHLLLVGYFWWDVYFDLRCLGPTLWLSFEVN